MEPSDGLLSVNGKSALEAMEAFMLLDLIGSTRPWPNFYDMYHETTNLFQRIVKIGKHRWLFNSLIHYSITVFLEDILQY